MAQLGGPENPAPVLWDRLLSSCVPVVSAGTVESRGSLSVLHVLCMCCMCSPCQLSLLSLATRCPVCVSAEPNTVSGTPCLLVLHRLLRAAVSQLWSWKRRVLHCSQAQQKREGNNMDRKLALCRSFYYVLPHLIPQ